VLTSGPVNGHARDRGSRSPVAAKAVSTTASSAGTCPQGTPTATVDGQATVNVSPDMATISIGVEVTSVTAKSAIASAAAKANGLVRLLEAKGIPVADIQTSDLSVSPDYNSAGTRVTGYQVDNDLSVEVTDLASVGSVVDGAAASAGNAIRVDGISFSVLDTSAPMARARTEAVQDGRAQAAAMAAGAGETIGPVCSLTDNSTVNQPPPVDFAHAAGTAAPTPVQPGTEQMAADVTVVYELVPRTAVTG